MIRESREKKNGGSPRRRGPLPHFGNTDGKREGKQEEDLQEEGPENSQNTPPERRPRENSFKPGVEGRNRKALEPKKILIQGPSSTSK